MSNLKVGDVVKLKSGGLNMTVTADEDKMVLCEWFEPTEDGGGERKQSDRFPKEALVKISEYRLRVVKP